MITLSADWLATQWPGLRTNGIIPIPLSVWDDGDCYTLASLGPLGAGRTVFGAVVLRGGQTADAKVRVVLTPSTDHRPSPAQGYQSPDGDWYTAEGQVDVNGRPTAVPVKIVEIAKALDERRTSLLESALLKDRTVLVIGLGTGGAQVAVELAKAGVGKFILIDPDRLDVGNVGRHLAGISHAGRYKVHTMKDLLAEKNPSIVTEPYPVSVNHENLEIVRGLVHKADLVIGATDGRASKLLINRICVEERKPVIFGGAFRRAYGGQALRVRPGQSACYHCFVMAMPEREADSEISSDEDAQATAYTDRPVAVEPGLALDVAPIALMMAKLALQELLVGKSSALHVLDRDFREVWYLWINRPEPKTEYAALPPLGDSVDSMTILRWYGIQLSRDPGCPTCGDLEGALRRTYDLQDPHLPAPQEVPLPPGLRN